jgi:hypothetical protein
MQNEVYFKSTPRCTTSQLSKPANSHHNGRRMEFSRITNEEI